MKSRLVAVATKRKPVLSIGADRITQESPCYIIAEVGNNHNGDMAMARKLVDAAIAAGATVVDKTTVRRIEPFPIARDD